MRRAASALAFTISLISAAGSTAAPFVGFEQTFTFPAAKTFGPSTGLSLTAADFDSDGIPDVVAGYRIEQAGELVIWFGNVDARYPRSRQARLSAANGQDIDTPVRSEHLSMPIEAVPDWLLAGDFDGDGHQDLAVVASGSWTIHWFPGRGDGSFDEVRVTSLGGPVVAAAAGEFGRRDTLTDLAFAIGTPADAGSESHLALFAHPNGALTGSPEKITLRSGHVTDIVLANLDGRPGNEALIVSDGRLEWAASDLSATREIAVEGKVLAATVGDFLPGRAGFVDVAWVSSDGLIRAQPALDAVAGRALDRGRIIGESWATGGELLTTGSARSPVQSIAHFRPGHVGFGLSVLTGRGRSKTELLTDDPIGALLSIRLDHDTLDDFVALPAAGGPPIYFVSKGGCDFTVTLESNEVDADQGDGQCDIGGAGGCTLRAAMQEASAGVGGRICFNVAHIQHSTDIQATQPVEIDGTTGTAGDGSGPGVQIEATSGFTGQLGLLAGGSVTGVHRTGGEISLQGGAATLEGNLICTDASGNGPAASGLGVIFTFGGSGTLGGTSAMARNVIACSVSISNGVTVSASANVEAVQVLGNHIGIGADGTTVIGNSRDGIEANGAATIGGTASGAGNVISGNADRGITASGAAVIAGNQIGVGADGMSAAGNGDEGVHLQNGDGFTVMGNTVANNGANGMIARDFLSNAGRSLVQENVLFNNGSDFNVGISASGEVDVLDNTVTGNTGGGISVGGLSTFPPTAARNIVGVDGDGNQGAGIVCGNNALVGGENTADGNTIVHNGGPGVSVPSFASSCRILGNSIHSNGGLGIDIEDDGITPNDPFDSDGGGNRRQNFPVLSEGGSGLLVTLDSTPNQNFRIELFTVDQCDPLGAGEGNTQIAVDELSTDETGNGTVILAGVDPGMVTATATILGGANLSDTSEFSACLDFTGGPPPVMVNSLGDAPDLTPGDGLCDTGETVPTGGAAGNKGGMEAECTYRAAITEANAMINTNLVRIDFGSIPPGPIEITGPLDQFIAPILVDCMTGPEGIVVIDGGDVVFGDSVHRLGDSSELRGCALVNFADPAVVLLGDFNEIRDSFFGLVPGEVLDSDGNATGLVVRGADNEVINTVFAHNMLGIEISGAGATRNSVSVSRIGIFDDQNVFNNIGVRISGASGNSLGPNNTVSFNPTGIEITGSASGNTVHRNLIGTNEAGSAPAASMNQVGVRIAGSATGNEIGGPGVTDRNIISGNTVGVSVTGASGNRIRGNFVGVNFDGDAAVPNTTGILIDGEPETTADNTIGGTGVNDGNVISGNGTGIEIMGSADTMVLGNRLGANETGGSALGAGAIGINATNAVGLAVGGAAAGEGNQIAGHSVAGVMLAGGSDVTVAGNMIGTDVSGVIALGNDVGIDISGVTMVTIGGQAGGASNLIGGSDRGIVIQGASSGVVVQNNRIGELVVGNVTGVDVRNGSDILLSDNNIVGNGSGVLVNGGSMVRIENNSISDSDISIKLDGVQTPVTISGNQLMRSADAGIELVDSDNATIRNNTLSDQGAPMMDGIGIVINRGQGNRLSENLISNSMGLAIDLIEANMTGVTENDPADTDIGANRLQNFPEITLAESDGLRTIVRGTLDSAPNAAFTIELYSNTNCHLSGNGEAETLIASFGATTDANGTASFATVPGLAIAGDVLTALAIAGNNNTSELSDCFTVVEVDPIVVLINEVDANAAPDSEFVELVVSNDPGALTGLVLVVFDGGTDLSVAAIDLGGLAPIDGRVVLGGSMIAGADLVLDDETLPDGPIAIALYQGSAAGFPDGTAITLSGLIDAVVLGTNPIDEELAQLLAANQPALDESASGDASGHAAQRCPDGFGGLRTTDLFTVGVPTPGAVNACVTCSATPAASSSDAGASHTIAVEVLADREIPLADVDVTLEVISGPHAGAMDSATTDAQGIATLAWDGVDGGSDVALVSGEVSGNPFACQAFHSWISETLLQDGFEGSGTGM